jgi:hypothetical protein
MSDSQPQEDGDACAHDEEATNWTSTSIFMNVIDDVTASPHTSTPVNIATFIGTRSGSRGDKGRRMYFADLNENTDAYRQDVLFPAFNDACRLDGFFSTSRGYQHTPPSTRLICNRSKVYTGFLPKSDQGSSDDGGGGGGGGGDGGGSAPSVAAADATRRKRPRNSRTGRPLSREERCHFTFPIFWDEERSLWYIWERSAGCLQHTGHCRVPPGEKKARHTVVVRHTEDSVGEEGAAAQDDVDDNVDNDGDYHNDEGDGDSHDDGDDDPIENDSPPFDDHVAAATVRTIRPAVALPVVQPIAATMTDVSIQQLVTITENVILPKRQQENLFPLFSDLCTECDDALTYVACVQGLRELHAKLRARKASAVVMNGDSHRHFASLRGVDRTEASYQRYNYGNADQRTVYNGYHWA